MKTVTLTISSLVEQEAPPGTQLGGFKFKLVRQGAEEGAETVTTETVVSFTDAEPGTYTASVQVVDAEGNPLGGLVQVEVVVPEDPQPVKFMGPAGLSVEVA